MAENTKKSAAKKAEDTEKAKTGAERPEPIAPPAAPAPAAPAPVAVPSGKLTRAGKVGKTESGQMVLVNEKNEAFATNPAVVAIWGLSDGKTEKEVIDKIAAEAKVDADEITPAVKDIIAKLLGLGLLK